MSSAHEIYYLDPNPAGSPAVLLLHGLGADGESWGYQFPALIEAGFRPIAPDLPGFGRSLPLPGARWTIRGVAAQLNGLLDRLGQDHVHVVGLSLGGVIAQRFALDYPERVLKLVLVNTFACLRPRRPDEFAYLFRRLVIANLKGVRAQADMVAQRIFPADSQADFRQLLVEKILHADPFVYRAAMRELALFNTRRKLSSIQTPSLVISGAQDSTVPLYNQEELARCIPGSRRVIIEGANHAVIADQPERFNEVLLRFLLE